MIWIRLGCDERSDKVAHSYSLAKVAQTIEVSFAVPCSDHFDTADGDGVDRLD